MLEAFATSRNLDNYENTVWLRIAPLEGTASWRSETMLLAKLLSFAVDYLIWLLPWWQVQKNRTEELM